MAHTYILKHIPEDFQVEEISTLPFSNLLSTGPFLYFRLTKKNMNTLDAVSQVARAVGLNASDIGFAGAKDKCAVTVQYCSARGGRKERFENLHLGNISVEVVGFGKTPLSLGDLSGNKFEIVIRNVVSTAVVKTAVRFVNYFDDQRFSNNNPTIGLHILRQEYVLAARLVDMPCVQNRLAASPSDGMGALRLAPLRLLRMYVHSYQSLLWNRVVSKLIKTHFNAAGFQSYLSSIEVSKEILYFPIADFWVNHGIEYSTFDVPLIGFTTASFSLDPIVEKVVSEVLREERITYADFIIKAFPELSCEGEFRSMWSDVADLAVSDVVADSFHSGFFCQKVSFTLGKGSYATMLMKSIIL